MVDISVDEVAIFLISRSWELRRKDFSKLSIYMTEGLSTLEGRGGHATPYVPVEMAKCWWLQKIEPNAWVGAKGSCLL